MKPFSSCYVTFQTVCNKEKKHISVISYDGERWVVCSVMP